MIRAIHHVQLSGATARPGVFEVPMGISYREIIFDVIESLARSKNLRDWPHLGVAIQAYTYAAAEDLPRRNGEATRRPSSAKANRLRGSR